MALAAATRHVHAEGVADDLTATMRGRSEIGERLSAVRTRLSGLDERAAAPRRATPREWQQRAEAAQRYAAAAQAAAKQALAYSAAAFRQAAEAHDRAAAEHESAAASGISQPHEHKRQAALHRAAAIRDRQRAHRVQSLLSGAGPADATESAVQLTCNQPQPAAVSYGHPQPGIGPGHRA